jgi:hypothetical protein
MIHFEDLVAQMAPSEFFSWGTLGTLAGASAATWAVGNAIGSLLGEAGRKWGALIVAMAISIGVFVYSVERPTGLHWFIAVLNGLLIFATALGFNEMVRPREAPRERQLDRERHAEEPRTGRRPFFDSWLP